MPKTVSYSDLESLVGQELGVSSWHEIDQERVNKFAEATGDYQWIHIDVERATKELGSPVAHGFLTLSLFSMLSPEVLHVEDASRVINSGTDKVRFINFVPVGSRLRLSQKCKSVVSKAGGKQVIMEATIEIEGQERPACYAEAINIFYGEE